MLKKVMAFVNKQVFYGEQKIRVFGPSHTPWFCAIDMSGILGYKSCDNMRRRVTPCNKMTLDELLREYGKSYLKFSSFDRKKAYFNVDGLIEIFEFTKSKEKEPVKAWFFNEVIPGIGNALESEEELKEELKEEAKIEKKEKKRETLRSLSKADTSDKKVAEALFDVINRAFKYEDKEVRTFILSEEIWFCGRDVATILGYENTKKSIMDNVDVEDKSNLRNLISVHSNGVLSSYPLENFTNNELSAIFINESGLYSLILKSKLKTAKQFKRYITKEVLPNIRKLGQDKYITELKEQLQSKDEKIREQEKKFYWLNTATKKSVSFKPFEENTGNIYAGSHPTEWLNFIQKMGGSWNIDKRAKEHSTSTSTLNKFNVEKFYSMPNELVLPFENYMQHVFSPFMVAVDKKKREHFMMHPSVMHSLIGIMAGATNECVKKINGYLDILEENDRDFIKTSEALGIKIPIEYENYQDFCEDIFLDETKEKRCIVCDVVKSLDEFEDSCKGNLRKECKSCVDEIPRKCQGKCGKTKPSAKYTINENNVRNRTCVDCVERARKRNLDK